MLSLFYKPEVILFGVADIGIQDLSVFNSSHLTCSFDTVLIFQFSRGIGTEASVPAILWYRFWYLGSCSYFSIPGFWCKVYSGLYAFFSF